MSTATCADQAAAGVRQPAFPVRSAITSVFSEMTDQHRDPAGAGQARHDVEDLRVLGRLGVERNGISQALVPETELLRLGREPRLHLLERGESLFVLVGDHAVAQLLRRGVHIVEEDATGDGGMGGSSCDRERHV